MSERSSHEQYVVAEVRRRGETDYRFNYWSYLGWTIVTLGLYSLYASYRLVQRRNEHARRRLAFLSYTWHSLNARADASGRREDVAEGMNNLSRIYAQLDAYERSHRREPVLWLALKIVGYVIFAPAAFVIGAVVNDFLNKDLRIYDEWESSFFANAEWVLQRLGYPAALRKRSHPVPERKLIPYALLTFVTAGLFSLYWRYVTMMDGNGHFDDDAEAEDALLRGLRLAPETPSWAQGAAPAGPPPVALPPPGGEPGPAPPPPSGPPAAGPDAPPPKA